MRTPHHQTGGRGRGGGRGRQLIQKRKPPETAHKKPKKDFGQEELKRKTEEVRDRINDMICVASCSELEVILEKLAKTSSLKLINDISQVLDGLFEESKIRALQQDLEWLVTEGWDGEGRRLRGQRTCKTISGQA